MSHVFVGFLFSAIWQTITPIVNIKVLSEFKLGMFGAQTSGFIFLLFLTLASLFIKYMLKKVEPSTLYVLFTVLTAISLPILTISNNPITLFCVYSLSVFSLGSWLNIFQSTFYELPGEIKKISKQVNYLKMFGGIFGGVAISIFIHFKETFIFVSVITGFFVITSAIYGFLIFSKQRTNYYKN